MTSSEHQHQTTNAPGGLFLAGSGPRKEASVTMQKPVELTPEEKALHQIETAYRQLFDNSPNLMFIYEVPTLRMLAVNRATLWHYGYSREEFLTIHVQDLHPAEEVPKLLATVPCRAPGQVSGGHWRHKKKEGQEIHVEVNSLDLIWEGRPARCTTVVDVSERIRGEEALQRRMTALTTPANATSSVEFEDLFDLEDIQRLQDQFAQATGVASLITRPDGSPITRPSGFTHLCAGIIRKTKLGSCNCFKSDAALGRPHADGPVVQPCLSGGLWDAGASIVVGGRHIANWLIGQVRNEAQDDALMRAYARKIGVDETTFMEAYHKVPVVSRERFNAVAQTLFTLSKQLSSAAYQNVQQARYIAERNQAEQALRLSEAQFRDTIERSGAGYFRIDRQGNYEMVNGAWLKMHGLTSPDQIIGRHFGTTQIEQDLAAAEKIVQQGFDGCEVPTGEFSRKLADGSVGYHSFSLHPVTRDLEVVALEGFVIDTTLLRHAVADYKMLFDTMLAGFAVHEIICDPAGKPVDYRFLAVNPAFEQQTGLKAEKLVGQTVLAVMPDTEQVWIDTYGRVALTGEPIVFEDFSKPLNRYFTVSAFRPSPGRFACMVVDITAQKVAEIELRKLSRAVNQSPSMVLITDVNGVIDYINPCFSTTTGYSLDEIKGLKTGFLREGVTVNDGYNEMCERVAAGRECRGEFQIRKKSGELFWESSRIGPIFGEDGRITHYLAISEDISERRRAEEQIREQAALLNVTQDAIIVTRLDRSVTYWNRAAAILYEIPAEAAGQKIEELTNKGLPSNYDEQWKILEEKREWTGERRQLTRSGRLIDVRIRAKIFCNANGNDTAVLFVGTDITESKQLEAQFLRAQRLESLGALASGVAHDLNNVLTPILLSVEMLRPLAKAPQDNEMLQLLSDSARRGSDIVQQLLLFGRGSDSPRAPINVAGAIKDVGRMMRGTFPKNIVLSVQAPADLWLVEADRTQVHQVLLNLCVNARDAMPQGGRLSLTAENVQVEAAFARSHDGKRVGSHVRIQVRDTGSGIAPQHLEKIFDPFFTTKPVGQGTGLGLSTVLGIVRSHEGILAVNSTVGEGTLFEIYLPAAASAAGPSAGEMGREPLMGKNELILLVEDEESIRSILQRTLLKHNYRVLVASDGAEALGVFAQNATKIQLVVTDILMPVMDGAQTVATLRRLNPHLPILAMSGLPVHRAEFEKKFGPRFRFLTKPFEIDHALQLVREVLDVGTPPAAS
jgi:PAS domain S-box-containing protein